MGELSTAQAEWLQGKREVVLITIRADGSPQSSNVLAHFDGSVFRVSVTAPRAKTRNLARDPRGIVHVLGETWWTYAAVSVRAELGAVTTTPGDDAGNDLLALYTTLTGGPHDDPDEFLRVMVDEQRLVLTLVPTGMVGSGW